VKIAIAGPGRSGTSFLIRLMSEWGFTTPSQDTEWLSDAEAGMERRIGSDSGFEIEKDPWAYEYLDRLDPSELRAFDALIVPLRSRMDSALSRSVQERLHRALTRDTDEWQWNSWGSVGGGALADTSVEGISRVLEGGLWDLLEVAARAGVQPVILAFPRMAADFDYLWGQLGHIVSSRVSEADARVAFDRIADPSKLHVDNDDAEGSAKVRELTSLVNVLRKKLSASEAGIPERSVLNQRLAEVQAAHDIAVDQRDAAFAESARLTARVAEVQAAHDMAVVQRDAIKQEADNLRAQLHGVFHSRSWRYTRLLRRR
jgi:hypothetical protein